MTRFADAVDVRWSARALSLCAFDRDPVAAGIPTARLLHHPWELVPRARVGTVHGMARGTAR